MRSAREKCRTRVAEIHLYRCDRDGFIRQEVAGIEYSTATWQLETFRNTLQGTLVDNHINLPGLSDGIRLLEKGIENRKERERERS